jgi:hypothetical protein
MRSFLALVASLFVAMQPAMALVPIPARNQGFVISSPTSSEALVTLEAFLDPLCPDSKAAFPNLVKVRFTTVLSSFLNLFVCVLGEVSENLQREFKFP